MKTAEWLNEDGGKPPNEVKSPFSRFSHSFLHSRSNFISSSAPTGRLH